MGGLTLLELLIAVAVVGILLLSAYPSYSSYSKRSARSAVQSLMIDLANREQQYLLDNRAYIGGGAAAVTTLLGSHGIPENIAANYDVAIAAPTDITFTITATPKAGSTMAGDGALTLDEAGTMLPADKWGGR